MTATFFVRECCRSRPDVLVRVAADDRTVGSGEIVRTATQAELEPDPVTAWHEAGHAVVGIGFGMVPVEITAAYLGYVRWKTQAPSVDAHIVMTMAGDFAADMMRRWEIRPIDAELKPFLSMIREPAGGGCDRCLILRTLVGRHGIQSSDEAVLSDYRQLEVRTLEILRRSRVRAAIRAVAAALMKSGHLSGEEAVAIAGAHVAPGELSETEKSDEADRNTEVHPRPGRCR
jgi:hypothetical protein